MGQLFCVSILGAMLYGSSHVLCTVRYIVMEVSVSGTC